MDGGSRVQAEVVVIGGGLAGCEAAWGIARSGVSVRLYEMKPHTFSAAHRSEKLAELVCSNSLRSDDPESAVGLLKREMAALGSLVMECARETAVPAGKALAVDRERFSDAVSARILSHPQITVERREITALDAPELREAKAVVVAAGPLASAGLSRSLSGIIGGESLFFYDAIAPIVDAESIDDRVAFRASRYDEGEGDYLNCPMSAEQYAAFRAALLSAEQVQPHGFEESVHFEGCLPIETLAERGELTMAFGPLKPVGLIDPKTGKQPFAVVQLRPENRERTMFNLVGFQTKLRYPEQERVFRLIPGLERASFLRLGSMHRNTYVHAPTVLSAEMDLVALPGTYLAGQITGVEGYVESAAMGVWVGLMLARKLKGLATAKPEKETMLGALLSFLATPNARFQPMNVNFGLTPPLQRKMGKTKRKQAYAERAQSAFAAWSEDLAKEPIQ